MRWQFLVAAIFALVGLVWIGQGLGILRGSSPMVEDLRWALAGMVLAGVGVVIGLNEARRSRPRS